MRNYAIKYSDGRVTDFDPRVNQYKAAAEVEYQRTFKDKSAKLLLRDSPRQAYREI